jgi:DUF971 family protein
MDPMIPEEIVHHQKSKTLELSFPGGERFNLSCEYLRVFSPSAEVRGHGPGQEVLQTGKKDVNITEIEPVGHYALKLRFSDGHDTGIYSWEYLVSLGREFDKNWEDYLGRLNKADASR